MKVRIVATVIILVVVCGFVITLLVLGISLEWALIAAGGVGAVAAEIARRLLPADSKDGAGESRTA